MQLSSRRLGCLPLLLICAVAMATEVAAAAGALPSKVAAPTASDCQNLVHQFDVAWPAHSEAKRAIAARKSRDLGDADCRAARYTEAVHNLRRALHDIGVKPVKLSSVSPQH